jgi:hypothetical protein
MPFHGALYKRGQGANTFIGERQGSENLQGEAEHELQGISPLARTHATMRSYVKLAWKMHNSRACQRRIALRFTVLYFCDLTVDRAVLCIDPVKHQYQILALQCEYNRLYMFR